MARRRHARDGRPLRVAEICPTEGAAYWLVQIAAGLAGRGYDVVAIIGGADGDTAANLRRARIPFAVLPHRIWSTRPWVQRLGELPYIGRARFLADVMNLLLSSVRMARLLRRLEVDATHAHVFHSILVGRLGGALARVPVRLAMVPGPYHLEVPVLRRMDVTTSRLDHRLICGSRRIEELYAEAGVPARRRTFVHYGADPREFDPARADGARIRAEFGFAPEAPVIGQVAHFYPIRHPSLSPPLARGRGHKGHEDHVEAARIVLEQRPDARFLMVGNGCEAGGERLRNDLRARCRALGIDHAVLFPGPRLDVPDVLAALDVSVQCSLDENYGGTIESLLMGRPTIATRVGGMPEVVRHEETGLLVPPRDPEALAAAILRLIEDPELGRRLGAAGRELVLDGYTTAACVRGVDRVLREVATERAIRRPPVASTG
jgi:glycosyltransferase involved in cell wall biosynthesis